jgi:hypothetical protein
VLVCVLSLAVGTQTVDLSTVWHAVTDYTDTGNQWIVYELRIPRTVLGIVVGIALGLSGALIQGITRNPLADSQILGLEGVAGLFVVSAIAFLGFHSLSSYLWFAFLGTFVAMLAVYGVAASGRLTATPVGRRRDRGSGRRDLVRRPAASPAGLRLDAVLGRRRARRQAVGGRRHGRPVRHRRCGAVSVRQPWAQRRRARR